MKTILVFAGGDISTSSLADELPSPDLVVAADSGYDLALFLGYRVDALVGDMDSISTVEVADHVLIEQHPADKDQTDLDLALDFAAGRDPGRVVVVGGTGGRFDHEVATIGLICSDRWAGIDEVDWVSSRGRAYVVRRPRILDGDVGSTMSLIPIGGPATKVRTQGLKWDLGGEDLVPGSTHGVSNVLRAPIADIRIESGCLLVVFPR
jgi:thiamine pyrophosphokinase